MPKQTRHSATFKAQVVLEMLKEERTVAQMAAAHQIHPGQLHRWKRQALDNFPQLFTESETLKQQAQAHDQEMTGLYAQIGKLTTQVEGLEKSGLDPVSGERTRLWDSDPEELPLAKQTDLLSLNRTSLYYRPTGPRPKPVVFTRHDSMV